MALGLTILTASIATFVMRFWFFASSANEQPQWLRRALRFVPAAAFSAILFPELVVRDGTLIHHTNDARLWAGLLAFVIALRTKNVFVTIVVGMVALYLLQYLFGFRA